MIFLFVLVLSLSFPTLGPGVQKRDLVVCKRVVLTECVLLYYRAQKSNANFFCTKFFENPSGHGRPRQKSWTSAPKTGFSCGPVVGRNFLTPGHPGVRVGNVRRKFGPKSLCLCCFSSLIYRNFLQASFPAVLIWQKNAMIFDFSWGPTKLERGHSRQNRPFTRPPFRFLSIGMS